MKHTQNTFSAFTLIELLVVIVIIGILATISTATFSGYFAQARDVERQSFIENGHHVIIASQIEFDSIDYDLGASDVSGLETALLNLFDEQGIVVPDDSNGIDYFYAINGNPNGSGSGGADLYALYACREDMLGDTASHPSEVLFLETNAEFLSYGSVNDGEHYFDPGLLPFCKEPPVALYAYTQVGGAPVAWLTVNLSD